MGRLSFRRQVTHRPGSHAARIEAFVRSIVQRVRGTPSSYAILATSTLGFRVTRMDVWRALNNMRLVRKSYALTPGLSQPRERAEYLFDMRALVASAKQLLFVDEKKFKEQELYSRLSSTGYAPPGVRLVPGYVFFFFFLLPPIILL